MSIEQIAVRFTNRPHPTPIEISIGHPYRQHWWLPIIGPTATWPPLSVSATAQAKDHPSSDRSTGSPNSDSGTSRSNPTITATPASPSTERSAHHQRTSPDTGRPT